MNTQELFKTLMAIINTTDYKKHYTIETVEDALQAVSLIVQMQQHDIESLEREGDYLRKMIQEN